MSSTNRGTVRNEADFYPTPKRAFEPLIPYLSRERNHWEPACGDRRLVTWMQNAGITAAGSDLSEGHDFLAETIPSSPEWAAMDDAPLTIITNPPFSLAQEFCEKALDLADEVFMLLRLNFLGAQKRFEWWRDSEPNALFVLSERPDFTGGGGDSTEYAWLYWGRRHTGIIHIMCDSPKPKRERKNSLQAT